MVVSHVGSVPIERVGQGEVGGLRYRVKGICDSSCAWLLKVLGQ